MNSKFTAHPLWLAGFRPLFTLALIYGALVPLLWVVSYSGLMAMPLAMNPMQWHAHEMLFGFGWAVLGGFLLTASKNWVKVRGIHGWPLITLTVLWLIERVVLYFSQSSESFIYWLAVNSFIVGTAFYVLWTLVVHRQKDTFRDNFFFYLLVIIFLISKNLLLSANFFYHGIAVSLGLFRLAFAVMFERTMTQFMKSTEGVDLIRHPLLDYAIKFLVLASVFQSWLPSRLSIIILGGSSVLLLWRWLLWKPHLGLKKFGNAVMYLGYLGLIIHFFAETFRASGVDIGASFSHHIFTFLCMGVVIPGMIVRICQGHTGRKPEFHLSDKVAISLIWFAAIFRLGLTMTHPENSVTWIAVSGALWSLCFLILSVRLIPFLFQPRIDGKTH